jgi:hypothetical protein
VTKTGLIKEEVKKNKDKFGQTIKSKADNYSLPMENEIKQEKIETASNFRWWFNWEGLGNTICKN